MYNEISASLLFFIIVQFIQGSIAIIWNPHHFKNRLKCWKVDYDYFVILYDFKDALGRNKTALTVCPPVASHPKTDHQSIPYSRTPKVFK